MISKEQSLRDSMTSGATMALKDYVRGTIAEHLIELEGASLARVRHIQGRIAALRSLEEVFDAGKSGAQPSQPNGGYTA